MELKENDQVMFRLRPEAAKLLPKLAVEVKALSFWIKQNVREEFLERVEDVFLTYGHEKGMGTTYLSGWAQNEYPQAKFYFTINFSKLEHNDYKSVNVIGLMNDIQQLINQHVGYKTKVTV